MTVIDTPEGIEAYRMLTLRRGLMMEIRTGMTLTRGRTCYAIVKSEFGLRGSKQKVLDQFEALLTERGILKPAE